MSCQNGNLTKKSAVPLNIKEEIHNNMAEQVYHIIFKLETFNVCPFLESENLRRIYIRAKAEAKATSIPICCIVSTLVFILEQFPSKSESEITFTS